MNEVRAYLRRMSMTTWMVVVAFLVILGGTATAASGLINGKKIKPGTITAKQLKNKSITAAKISPSVLTSLKGSTGATGPAGSAGTTGPTGAAGSNGVVDPISAEAYDKPLPNGDQVDLLTLAAPSAGTYLLTAKANLTSNTASNDINCAIWVDDTSGVDVAMVDPIGFNETVPVSMMAVSQVQSSITLKCTSMDGVGSADDIKLVALPVQG